MDVSTPTLVAGDVYAHAHADRMHVVLAVSAGLAVTCPIQYHNCPAMRGDVLVCEINDLAALGLRGGRYLIRPALLAVGDMPRGPRIGRLPDAMRVAVQAAARRESVTRNIEARLSPALGHRGCANLWLAA